MTFRRLSIAIVLFACTALADVPERLTDQQFWQISEEMSEPSAPFNNTDNLLSNELVFARAVPELVARAKPGGVYLGVGPEQNFTYIAAVKPRMAFITDIRRGNLHLQLMYKALFELSVDRADFISRLFTKPRQPGMASNLSADGIMAAFWDVPTSGEDVYAANLKAIQDHLTRKHTLPLSDDDLAGIARVYRAFYWYGPWMTYSAHTSLGPPPGAAGTTYRALMAQADATGQEFSYLSSEEKFRFVKDLESRNMLVPVVGNFAGPKALRAVGAWIREHGAVVSAFYLSNVESCLRGDGNSWNVFCPNLATFPLDKTSVFIRPSGSGLPLRGISLPAPAIANSTTTVAQANCDEIRTYTRSGV